MFWPFYNTHFPLVPNVTSERVRLWVCVCVCVEEFEVRKDHQYKWRTVATQFYVITPPQAPKYGLLKTDRQADRQTGRQTDRQADRQACLRRLLHLCFPNKNTEAHSMLGSLFNHSVAYTSGISQEGNPPKIGTKLFFQGRPIAKDKITNNRQTNIMVRR